MFKTEYKLFNHYVDNDTPKYFVVCSVSMLFLANSIYRCKLT